jgi:hypothetical protein
LGQFSRSLYTRFFTSFSSFDVIYSASFSALVYGLYRFTFLVDANFTPFFALKCLVLFLFFAFGFNGQVRLVVCGDPQREQFPPPSMFSYRITQYIVLINRVFIAAEGLFSQQLEQSHFMLQPTV